MLEASEFSKTIQWGGEEGLQILMDRQLPLRTALTDHTVVYSHALTHFHMYVLRHNVIFIFVKQGCVIYLQYLTASLKGVSLRLKWGNSGLLFQELKSRPLC